MKATKMKAPDATPAAPNPAMARPMIKAVLFGATARRSSQQSIANGPRDTRTTDETSQLKDEDCR
jgi:hypothetical protein